MFKKMMFLAVMALIALGLGAAGAEEIKIGAVAPKSGPLAAGAATTHWPNIKLWVSQVNGRGGLVMKNGEKRKIKLIEYDDRTNPVEHIKALTRLATQDKVDFVIAPYATGFNIATAPIFDKFGYPQITTTSITDKIPELTAKYSGIFFTLGSTTSFVQSVVDILSKMRKQGKMGDRVAMVNVADDFGIELRQAALPIFKKAGFNIVYDQSYSLGTPDLSPIMKKAKAARPDAFVAWSYPPDTFGLTAQAKIQNLKVKAFYTAVATSFPIYGQKFGAAANGILGAGGVNPDAKAFRAYAKAHLKVSGQAPDFWASAVVYASLQVLEQAIEGVGAPDRKAVTEYIKNHSFKTVMGTWKFENQVIPAVWTVGQWQKGKYYGVASTGMPGAKPVQVKKGW